MNKNHKKAVSEQILPIDPLSSPFLLSLTFFATFAGFNIWRSTFHNYSVQVFQADATQIGTVFSLMSVPGVLAFSIGLVARKVQIYKLLIFACTLLGAGLIWISLAPTWNAVWPGIVAIGFGFTFFYPVINTLCLLDSAPETAAVRIGQLKSYGPLASIGATLLVILFLQAMAFGFRPFLAVTGTLVTGCGLVAALSMRPRRYTLIQGTFRLEPALWPYYTLNFLAGCRSALFKTFVLFLLVNEHGFEINSTALVILVGNLAGFFGYRLIGRIASRYRRSTVLSAVYAGVALIFLGFAVFEQITAGYAAVPIGFVAVFHRRAHRQLSQGTIHAPSPDQRFVDGPDAVLSSWGGDAVGGRYRVAVHGL
ncbi:MAG: MFS transporter [Candidatus Competibacteraceae bacterium]